MLPMAVNLRRGSRIATMIALGVLVTVANGSEKNAEARRSVVRSEVVRAAVRHHVDPRLAVSVAKIESGFEPWARSNKGAIGVMQLMPGTARQLGVNPRDYRQNIDAGVRHLRWLQQRYPGNLEAALAAYNAGVGAVDRHGGIPPFAETEQYIGSVMSEYRGAPVRSKAVRQSRSANARQRMAACAGTEIAFDAAGRLYVRSRAVGSGCEPLR